MSTFSREARVPFYLCVFFILSCSSIEEKREAAIVAHVDCIKKHAGSWDTLARRLVKKFDPKIATGMKMVKEIEEPLRKELEEKGIEGIWPRSVGECTEVEIYTDWAETSEERIRLTWTSCRTQESGKAFYSHWDTGIRIEKITDHWYLWMVY